MDLDKVFIPNEKTSQYKQMKKLNENLYKELHEMLRHNNTFTESEFYKYSILFSKRIKDRLSVNDGSSLDLGAYPPDVRELVEEFYSRIDPFRPIDIVDDETGKVIITFPRIFSSTSQIENNQDNIAVIEKMRSSAMTQSPIEYQKAINSYITQFLDSQKQKDHLDDLKKARKEYKRAMDDLSCIKNESSDKPVEVDIDVDGIVWE